ncbi:RNA-directed DNA polymerase from transposon X-element [Salix suchowensis]|nr:RNA-directed DNA polymerase from transposon X-element [Salix suchowensis]
MRADHAGDFLALSASLPTASIQAFSKLILDWEAGLSEENPYAVTVEGMSPASAELLVHIQQCHLAITANKVRLQMAQEEEAAIAADDTQPVHDTITPRIFIEQGLELLDQQARLHDDAQHLGTNLTEIQQTRMTERCNDYFVKLRPGIQFKSCISPAHCSQRNRALRQLLILSTMYQSKDRMIRGQSHNTCSVTLIHNVQMRVNFLAANGLLDKSGWQTTLRLLEDSDLRSLKGGEDASSSEGQRTLSWIWMTQRTDESEMTDTMSEVLRIEWCKSRARAQRWQEECILLKEEMRRIIQFHTWEAETWAAHAREATTAGACAYAWRQNAARLHLASTCTHTWRNLTAYFEMGEGAVEAGMPLVEAPLRETKGSRSRESRESKEGRAAGGSRGDGGPVVVEHRTGIVTHPAHESQVCLTQAAKRPSPIHDEAQQLGTKYKQRLEEVKLAHWEDFLEDLDPQELWIANKYISSPGSDRGKVRVPSLKFNMPDGSQKEAASNEEKGCMLADMFFPKRPVNFTAIAPEVLPELVEYDFAASTHRTKNMIARLKPFKVCRPDGIPNVVLMRCSDTLAPILTRIYEAAFQLNHYPQVWKRWTTIVLKKPGKPRYDLAKAWRPIALLNTMAKVLTALAWSRGRVVSSLFLDIEAAFPNAVTDQLLTNLWKRRIPANFVSFIRSLLVDRQTTMVFDDYKSDWINVDNGIGQGDPISMILFYNADLVDIPIAAKGEAAIAYVDDVTFIAEANTIKGAHRKLKNMMTRQHGAYEWSANHNSRFEAGKLRVMNFTPRQVEHPVLTLLDKEVVRETSYRILGIIIDEHLQWREQTAAASVRQLSESTPSKD